MARIEQTNSKWSLTPYEIVRTPHPMIEDNAEIAVNAQVVSREFSCPICLDLLKCTMVSKDCLHRFCSECIVKALRTGKKECPTCRRKIVSKRSLRPDKSFDEIVSKLFPDENQTSQEDTKMRNVEDNEIIRTSNSSNENTDNSNVDSVLYSSASQVASMCDVYFEDNISNATKTKNFNTNKQTTIASSINRITISESHLNQNFLITSCIDDLEDTAHVEHYVPNLPVLSSSSTSYINHEDTTIVEETEENRICEQANLSLTMNYVSKEHCSFTFSTDCIEYGDNKTNKATKKHKIEEQIESLLTYNDVNKDYVKFSDFQANLDRPLKPQSPVLDTFWNCHINAEEEKESNETITLNYVPSSSLETHLDQRSVSDILYPSLFSCTNNLSEDYFKKNGINNVDSVVMNNQKYNLTVEQPTKNFQGNISHERSELRNEAATLLPSLNVNDPLQQLNNLLRNYFEKKQVNDVNSVVMDNQEHNLTVKQPTENIQENISDEKSKLRNEAVTLSSSSDYSNSLQQLNLRSPIDYENTSISRQETANELIIITSPSSHEDSSSSPLSSCENNTSEQKDLNKQTICTLSLINNALENYTENSNIHLQSDKQSLEKSLLAPSENMNPVSMAFQKSFEKDDNVRLATQTKIELSKEANISTSFKASISSPPLLKKKSSFDVTFKLLKKINTFRKQAYKKTAYTVTTDDSSEYHSASTNRGSQSHQPPNQLSPNTGCRPSYKDDIKFKELSASLGDQKNKVGVTYKLPKNITKRKTFRKPACKKPVSTVIADDLLESLVSNQTAIDSSVLASRESQSCQLVNQLSTNIENDNSFNELFTSLKLKPSISNKMQKYKKFKKFAKSLTNNSNTEPQSSSTNDSQDLLESKEEKGNCKIAKEIELVLKLYPFEDKIKIQLPTALCTARFIKTTTNATIDHLGKYLASVCADSLALDNQELGKYDLSQVSFCILSKTKKFIKLQGEQTLLEVSSYCEDVRKSMIIIYYLWHICNKQNDDKPMSAI